MGCPDAKVCGAPSLLVVFSDLRCSRPFRYLPCPLSFQLVDLPSDINGIQSLCQVFSPGPGNWTSMHDAQHLCCKWHFPIEIDDFHVLSLSQFRWHQVGARREEAVRELDGDLASCPFPAWFSVSFHCVLWKAVFWEIRSRF